MYAQDIGTIVQLLKCFALRELPMEFSELKKVSRTFF